MKRNTLLLFFLLQIKFIWGQADISMATHWYNRANYNPASIARTDYIYLFTNARKQWMGVTGTPQTLNIQASGFNYNLRSAFGISLVADQIGIVKVINPLISYAYRLSNDDDWSLSFGLSGGVYSRYIDKSQFNPGEIYDPLLYVYLDRLIKPDINFGLEFQSDFLIAGISSTHLLSLFDKSVTYHNMNHRYGYLIYKNTNLETLNYYAGIQIVNRSNLTIVEGNATLRLKHATGLSAGANEIMELGVTYRSSKRITALFAVNVSPDFRIGYAYDQSLIQGYNQNGSHEIMLEYRIPVKSAECKICRQQNSWYR